MSYDARSVANFFLSCAEAEGIALSPMALLKILYFAHAWHLAKYKVPLVAQKFEAWQRGPVNRVVYEQVKKFGRDGIKERLVVLDAKSAGFVEPCFVPDAELHDFLVNIYSYYSKFHAFKLSDITHAEGTPWDRVWKEAERGAVPGMWIPDDLIKEWFEKTGGRLYLAQEQGVNT